MADINDIVLIYADELPQVFARIDAIEPDIKRDWYHVKLLLLQIPLQVVTWILRDVYINGEIFTMEGRPMRLELVESPEPPVESEHPSLESGEGDSAKVISLKDLKKK